jgi:hypothetical protein
MATLEQCLRGHAYDAENTYVDKRGKRFCRACAVIRDKARRERAKTGEPPPPPKPPATHCKNGHPMTEENVRRRSDGYRQCRTCERANNRAHRVRVETLPGMGRPEKPGVQSRPQQPPDVRWLPLCPSCDGFGFHQYGFNNWPRCTATGCRGGYVWEVAR